MNNFKKQGLIFKNLNLQVDLGAYLLNSESASSFKVGSLFERNKQKQAASPSISGQF